MWGMRHTCSGLGALSLADNFHLKCRESQSNKLCLPHSVHSAGRGCVLQSQTAPNLTARPRASSTVAVDQTD